MPSESFTLSTFMWIAVGYGNVLLLCVTAPFLATLLLDGLVMAGRGEGSKRLLIAVAAAAVAIFIGVTVWHTATGIPGVPASLDSGMMATALYLLPVTSAVALLAFIMPLVSSRARARAASHGSNHPLSAARFVKASSAVKAASVAKATTSAKAKQRASIRA